MNAAHSTTLLNLVATRVDDRSEGLAVRVASVLFITVFTAAAAQISFSLPFTQVPLTFQPMVVLVGGLVLGSRLGFTSQVIYLLAGVAGLPVFARNPHAAAGTPARWSGQPALPDGLANRSLRGWLSRGTRVRKALRHVGIGHARWAGDIYAAGTLWLGYFARLVSGSAAVGLSAASPPACNPFVLADLAKLAAAAASHLASGADRHPLVPVLCA